VPRIYVDIDKLFRAARAYREAGQQLRNMARDSRNSLSHIEWEGVSRNTFQGQCSSWERDLDARAKALEQLASRIHQIAESYARADRG
jgi:WXG100 family type VII secretion target